MAHTTQVTHTNRTIFSWQLTSVLLMATGFGWINGNFVQPVSSPWGAPADIIHLIPVVTLIWLSVVFFGASIEGRRTRGTRIWISLVASSGVLTCVAFIILGLVNPDPNSVGVHNFEDLMPVIVLNLGTILWFILLPFKATTSQIPATSAKKEEVLQ